MGNMQELMHETVSVPPDTLMLKNEFAMRRARLDRFAQLRTPHIKTIEAELRASDAGRQLLNDARRLNWLARATVEAQREGKLAQADALALVSREQAAYRAQHGDLLVATRVRHAASDASAAQMAAVVLGTETTDWVIEGGEHGPTRFGPADRPGGGGSGEGPEGEPAPAPPPPPPLLDETVGAPYSLPANTNIWASGLTAQQPEATATPRTGQCMVNAWGFGAIATGGGSVCRAMVGSSFALPAQSTQLDVSADITIDASLLAIALLGIAGGGLDYWLRIDTGDGSEITERSIAAGQVIAPVLWTAQWNAVVQQRISARIVVAPGVARNVQVYAGVNGHAEAGGVDCGAYALGFATVTSIRVVAR
jgi:hypothetical protein